ncbi:MAG: helix-turn-helix domain-containing protein [Oscillospiraceae bacterium]|nr:helix-turn-helix domain-containing protein [Oscillospiraceae bacterium]
MVDFGEKLRKLRTDKGLSQEKLANRLVVTKSMISAYENSVRLPSYDVLIKIALFFNVSMDYFFGFNKHQFLDTTNLSEEQIEIISRLIDQFKQK